MQVMATSLFRLVQNLLRWPARQPPISWVASRWRHEWYWSFHRWLFEHRHYRRLLPLVGPLGVVLLIWFLLVGGLALLFGGTGFILERNFVQSFVASLLVLPIGLAIAVVVGTLVQQHSLRFQARHAGDDLANCVGSAIFGFIVFLKSDCAVPIDLEGAVGHKLVHRARKITVDFFVASDWSIALPHDFEDKLYKTIDEVSDCFARADDLRLAFPHAFDLIDDLRSTVSSIRAGHSSSSPENTSLILLHYGGQILRNLQ